MEPATILIICIGAAVLAVTGYAIYIAFGPPAAQLNDPFDEHED